MQGKRFTKVDAAGPPPSVWGDLDGDGAIGPADITAIQKRVGTQVTGPRDPADLDGNGMVTAADAQIAQSRTDKLSAGGPTFRVSSYNMGNMFDSTKDGFPKLETVLSPEQYGTKLARVAGSIRDQLGAPQVIAMQEVENERVLRDLVARPELKDLGYKFVLLEGEDIRGIDNALLYRSDQVTLGDVRQLVVPNPNPKANRENLFSRAPLVADLRVAGTDGSSQELTLIANHFKSHYSPSGAPTEGQRILEAKAVKSHVRDLRRDDPDRPVMVLGDLNDGVGSKPVETLLGGTKRPLLHDVTAELIPPGERYSFIFRGEQNLLDHVLTTKDLATKAVWAGVKHINVDLAESTAWGSLPYGASDHDPVYVDFAFNNAGPAQAAAGAGQLAPPPAAS
jgi:predicted extracellular nuclease